MVVDSTGVATKVPMDEWMEIGVFGPAEEGEELGEPLYVQMHRIRSGEQTITVTGPRKPKRAGIDFASALTQSCPRRSTFLDTLPRPTAVPLATTTAAYLRVSTVDQTLALQRRGIRRFAERADLDVTDWGTTRGRERA